MTKLSRRSVFTTLLITVVVALMASAAKTPAGPCQFLSCHECLQNPICGWCGSQFTTNVTQVTKGPRCVENTKRYNDKKWRHGWGNMTQQLWVDFAGKRYRDYPTETETDFIAKNYAIVSLEKCFATGVNKWNEISVPGYLKQLKQRNPTVLVLWYYNILKNYYNCYEDGQTILDHPSWWLIGSNGQPLGDFQTKEHNFSIPAVRDYVVDAATNFSENYLFDGIFADHTAEQKPGQLTQAAYDKIVPGKKWTINMTTYMMKQRFNKTVPGGPKLLGNSLFMYPQTVDDGLNTLPYMDGSCFEHFLSFEMLGGDGYPHLSLTQTAFDNIEQASEYGREGGKIILVRAFPGPVSGPIVAAGPAYRPQSGLTMPSDQASRQQFAKDWIVPLLAAYLIVANENTFFSYNWWYTVDTGVYPCGYNECGAPQSWYPELWKKIGAPLGNYTKEVDARGDTIYRRRFGNANITYNASHMASSFIEWLDETEDEDYCPIPSSSSSSTSSNDQSDEFYPLEFQCPTVSPHKSTSEAWTKTSEKVFVTKSTAMSAMNSHSSPKTRSHSKTGQTLSHRGTHTTAELMSRSSSLSGTLSTTEPSFTSGQRTRTTETSVSERSTTPSISVAPRSSSGESRSVGSGSSLVASSVPTSEGASEQSSSREPMSANTADSNTEDLSSDSSVSSLLSSSVFSHPDSNKDHLSSQGDSSSQNDASSDRKSGEVASSSGEPAVSSFHSSGGSTTTTTSSALTPSVVAESASSSSSSQKEEGESKTNQKGRAALEDTDATNSGTIVAAIIVPVLLLIIVVGVAFVVLGRSRQTRSGSRAESRDEEVLDEYLLRADATRGPSSFNLQEPNTKGTEGDESTSPIALEMSEGPPLGPGLQSAKKNDGLNTDFHNEEVVLSDSESDDEDRPPPLSSTIDLPVTTPRSPRQDDLSDDGNDIPPTALDDSVVLDLDNI